MAQCVERRALRLTRHTIGMNKVSYYVSPEQGVKLNEVSYLVSPEQGVKLNEVSYLVSPEQGVKLGEVSYLHVVFPEQVVKLN